jgi:BolA protein
MSTAPVPLSAQIHARLTERLQPTALRVVDESADHAGHGRQ